MRRVVGTAVAVLGCVAVTSLATTGKVARATAPDVAGSGTLVDEVTGASAVIMAETHGSTGHFLVRSRPTRPVTGIIRGEVTAVAVRRGFAHLSGRCATVARRPTSCSLLITRDLGDARVTVTFDWPGPGLLMRGALTGDLAVGAPSGTRDLPCVAEDLAAGATATPSSTLRAAAGDQRYVGAAVSLEHLTGDLRYREVVAREFTMVTPENEMKFGWLHPLPHGYDFCDADAVVGFAAAHGQKVRGHTLVWHQSVPAWISSRHWTRDELLAVLREHITTTVAHFRRTAPGVVVHWDVVNEAVADDGSLRPSIWRDVIGPDYIAHAFRWAHEADPTALLFYNDHDSEGINAKSNAIYRLVRDLLQQGVPIHGVGLQMHLIGSPQRGTSANMARLAALGLRVAVTELDVVRPAQGVFGSVAAHCVALGDDCPSLTLWGVTDRYSWRRVDAPLPIDADYGTKPQWAELLAALTAGRSS